MAQGDGEVKRREDQRRQKQAPTNTLFVVNFDVANTREADLAYTFEKFGPTKRVQIKKNFAFIQVCAALLTPHSFLSSPACWAVLRVQALAERERSQQVCENRGLLSPRPCGVRLEGGAGVPFYGQGYGDEDGRSSHQGA